VGIAPLATAILRNRMTDEASGATHRHEAAAGCRADPKVPPSDDKANKAEKRKAGIAIDESEFSSANTAKMKSVD